MIDACFTINLDAIPPGHLRAFFKYVFARTFSLSFCRLRLAFRFSLSLSFLSSTSSRRAARSVSSVRPRSVTVRPPLFSTTLASLAATRGSRRGDCPRSRALNTPNQPVRLSDCHSGLRVCQVNEVSSTLSSDPTRFWSSWRR